MSKRTKFLVNLPNGHVARFSEEWHARLFSEAISDRMPWLLIELLAPDGLIGQYRDGAPTPEFEQHHIDGLFR
jgi:hypothetical protein